MSNSNPKVQVAGTAALTLLLGLASGFVIATQVAGGEGVVELEVAGALSVSVFCGGATTHGTGTKVSFVAANTDCEVEAPLSPSMPLRGPLRVGVPGKYRCSRQSAELECKGPL